MAFIKYGTFINKYGITEPFEVEAVVEAGLSFVIDSFDAETSLIHSQDDDFEQQASELDAVVQSLLDLLFATSQRIE